VAALDQSASWYWNKRWYQLAAHWFVVDYYSEPVCDKFLTPISGCWMQKRCITKVPNQCPINPRFDNSSPLELSITELAMKAVICYRRYQHLPPKETRMFFIFLTNWHYLYLWSFSWLYTTFWYRRERVFFGNEEIWSFEKDWSVYVSNCKVAQLLKKKLSTAGNGTHSSWKSFSHCLMKEIDAATRP